MADEHAGQPLARIEDGALLIGRGRFADDLSVNNGALYAAILVKEMGELGERTENMAATLGISAQQFSLLSNAMQLAGGNADTFARAMILLEAAPYSATSSIGCSRSSRLASAGRRRTRAADPERAPVDRS